MGFAICWSVKAKRRKPGWMHRNSYNRAQKASLPGERTPRPPLAARALAMRQTLATIAVRPCGARLLEGAFASGLDVLGCLLLCCVLRFFRQAQFPQPGGFFQSKPRGSIELLLQAPFTLLNFGVALFSLRSGCGHFLLDSPLLPLARNRMLAFRLCSSVRGRRILAKWDGAGAGQSKDTAFDLPLRLWVKWVIRSASASLEKFRSYFKGMRIRAAHSRKSAI